MTATQVAEIMDILHAAYPAFYRTTTERDDKMAVKLWASMFADDNPALVVSAVKALIACDTKGYPPHIGAVKDYMGKLTQPDEMTGQEAWSIIHKAICNSGYDSAKEYAKLPTVLQRLVGSANQLRDWSMMDSDTVNSVVASNFMKSYRDKSRQEREYLALPQDVKSAIGQITERMTMPQLTEGEA